MQAEAETEISVIVCTHNRPETLALLLASLDPQMAGLPVELVVVDSASRPEAAAAAERMVGAIAGARLVRVEQPGVSLARNAGIAQASAPWIAFLDDDEVPAADWLAQAQALIRRLPADCAICGGNVRPVYPKGPHPAIGPRWSAYLSTILRDGEFDQTEDLQFGIGHSLVRTAALYAVPGFDERLGRHGGSLLSGEEVLLAEQLMLAGWRIWHSDRIEVGHIIEPERLTTGWVRRRAYWEGVTSARMLGIHDRGALHRKAARVAAKAGPLGVAALVAPNLRELRLRFAFASGFLSGYVRQVAADPFGRVSASPRPASRPSPQVRRGSRPRSRPPAPAAHASPPARPPG